MIRFLIFTRVVGLLYTQRGGEWALRTIKYYWITCKNQALRPIYTKGTPTLFIQYPNPRVQSKAVRRERMFSLHESRKHPTGLLHSELAALDAYCTQEPVYLIFVTPPCGKPYQTRTHR